MLVKKKKKRHSNSQNDSCPNFLDKRFSLVQKKSSFNPQPELEEISQGPDSNNISSQEPDSNNKSKVDSNIHSSNATLKYFDINGVDYCFKSMLHANDGDIFYLFDNLIIFEEALNAILVVFNDEILYTIEYWHDTSYIYYEKIGKSNCGELDPSSLCVICANLQIQFMSSVTTSEIYYGKCGHSLHSICEKVLRKNLPRISTSNLGIISEDFPNTKNCIQCEVNKLDEKISKADPLDSEDPIKDNEDPIKDNEEIPKFYSDFNVRQQSERNISRINADRNEQKINVNGCEDLISGDYIHTFGGKEDASY